MSKKRQIFICVVVALSVIGLCLCGQLFYLQQAYASDQWYDQECICVNSSIPTNEDCNVTAQVECQLKTTSYGIETIDAISIACVSSNYAVLINQISLESLVDSSNLGTWTLADTNSNIVFDGKTGDTNITSIYVLPGETATFKANITELGDIYKYFGCCPVRFTFNYSMVPKTVKAVLYSGSSLKEQISSTKLMSSTDSSVNAAGNLVFYDNYYDYSSVGTVYSISSGARTWSAAKALTKSIVFDSSFKDFQTSTCANWFEGFSACESITGLSDYVDTSQSNSFYCMFKDCRTLTAVDVKGLNTSNGTTMQQMFMNCDSLTSLDVTGWNTSKVTTMQKMFASIVTESPNQNKIETIKGLNSWDVSQVSNMQAMFRGDVCFLEINVPSWTPKLTQINQFCRDCWKLNYINVKNFNTSGCTNFSQIFMNAAACSVIWLSYWDISNASGSSEFGCGLSEAFSAESYPYSPAVRYIEIYHPANTSIKVTGDACKLSKCFANQSYLIHIYVPPNTNWCNGTAGDTCFAGCAYWLVGDDWQKWKSYMLGSDYAKTASPGRLMSKTDTATTASVSSLANKQEVLDVKSNKATAYLDNNVLYLYGDGLQHSGTYFEASNNQPGWTSCKDQILGVVIDESFKNVDIESVNSWFEDCESLTYVKDIQYIPIGKLSDCSSLFKDCTKLSMIICAEDVDWSTQENIENSENMFEKCGSLPNFDWNKTDKTMANRDGYFI